MTRCMPPLPEWYASQNLDILATNGYGIAASRLRNLMHTIGERESIPSMRGIAIASLCRKANSVESGSAVLLVSA
jgi:hypothetical protein